MVANPACCCPDTDLAKAAALLQKQNCGALPIVDHNHRAIGIITDRDICIAVGTNDKRAAELCVQQVVAEQSSLAVRMQTFTTLSLVCNTTMSAG
jgi:CBS domain-containing protein